MPGIFRATYAEIGRRIRELPPEHSGFSYEWEELVHKLCASDDPELHTIGIKEMDELKESYN